MPHQAVQPLRVTIDNTSVEFDGVPAIENVELTIDPGELFTLLGPSGCGKTTLLRAIAGFNTVSNGEIRFNQKNVIHIPAWKRDIGFVFQNYALWPTKNIFNNVAYGLHQRKVSKQEVTRRVAEVLDLVGLSDSIHQFPSQLSGGMQQRAALARALVIDPPLLLLDEPLCNLDAKLRVSLRRGIRDIQRRLGITAIYVTHDQEEALDISHRIAVMYKGSIVQVGTPENIYQEPINAFVADFIGRAVFIRGKLLDKSTIELTNGDKIHTSFPAKLNGNLEDICCVFCRPEELKVVPETEANFTAIIQSVSYLGNFYQYLVELSDSQEVIVETQEQFPEKQVIGLAFKKLTGFHQMPQDFS
ncbi:ABC transporter ATP-binding protein [Vibrio penaeicida]|uniref:ABC transporter ATP-binding protein n=1 Tax=Vibrio penaeicida TaxID=104609 RepID=UPI00142DA495|nr:ABC transporter ATP-binding protein [Vibrio penaeicida]